MRKMIKLIKQACLVLAVVWLSSPAHAQITMEEVNGSWLGTMNIPEGPSLKIGVEIFKKADGEWGGNIASLDQGVRYMLVSNVNAENGILTVQMANAPVSITGKMGESNNVIVSIFKQGDSEFDLVLHKVDALPEIERKQTPQPTDDYIKQDVAYQNAQDGTWLAGTLTLPKGNQKHPAIMLVAGSGPNHRDSYHAGHRTFKVLADHLTREGFVVLRSDKRGVYKSAGKFEDATLENLALDTQSAVRFLKSHPRVDSQKLILIGHSEGSLVSVMAAQEASIQGIVSMAGPGMSVLDILLLQDQTEPAAKGASKAETDILLKFSQRFYAMVLNTPSPEERKNKALMMYDNLAGSEAEVVAKWVNKNNGTLSISSAQSTSFYEFLQQSPLPYWNQFSGKALVLNGGKDSQVPAEANIAGIVNAVDKSRAEVESHLFEGLNHLFQPAETGSIDEYQNIETTIDNDVLSVISTWLKQNFR